MNRLTKKISENYCSQSGDFYDLYNKLGQYEDIDEEIGIDYISLNKLRKSDKIYVKFFNEIQEYTRFKIDLRECKILYGYMNGKGYGLQQPLSNYNKLFSLSKEELEK